jgi:hypothetical protein
MNPETMAAQPENECMGVGTWDKGTAPHLIIVAYALSPGPGGAEAIVNARLLRALAEYWPSGVSVISAGGPPSLVGGGCLSGRPGWVFHTGSGSIKGLGNRQSFVYRCINRGIFELTGEGLKGQCWMRFAGRALHAELAEHPNAIVYSRALPFTSIDVVRRARRSRNFRWIVNINDPLPPDIWPDLYPFEAKTCETMRHSLNTAMPFVDAFTFPCAQLRALELQVLNGLGGIPTAILPHLPSRLPSAPNGAASTSTRLQIVYAGTMNRGRVRAEFVSAVTEFARQEPKLAAQLHFSFYLTHPNRFALEFIRTLPFSTSVSIGLQPEECDEALLSADILLDIAADVDAPLLQTKMATYMGLSRPVWAVCKPGSTSWNLVQRGWGYASDVSSGESIVATLREIFADWNAGALWRRLPPAPLLERFAPQRHVADLLALCEYVGAAKSRSDGSASPNCLRTEWP